MTLRRATGEAAFAADLTRPGTLHLALCRSPIAHARVTRCDTGDARALPGVVAALTAEDTDGLLDPVLRYVGDRAAVVAAEDPELARRAAELVRLELEPLTPVLDAEAAADAPGQVAERIEIGAGDVESALARADRVVDGTWSFPFAPSVPLEPPVALTWLDEDRRLVVRTSAESPFRVRGLLADRLGIPAARIRVVRPLVAGGAGGRSDVHVEDLCGLLTLRTGRPARLALSAEEELITSPGRPPQRVHIRLALDDGGIKALFMRLLVDVGEARDGVPDLLRSAARQALALYRFPHMRVEGIAVRTHRPPTASPRGADDEAAFALECAVAEAAAVLGEDPVPFRRRHLRHPQGSPDVFPGLEETPAAADARAAGEVLEAAASRVGWYQRDAGAGRGGPVRRTLGIGLARRSAGTSGGTGAAASLRLLEDGSFTLAAAPSSTGGIDEDAFAAAAAAVLGVLPHRVILAAADTDSAPFEVGDPAPAFFAAGRAVEEAARLARERIREAGARMLERDTEDVEVREGTVREAGGRSATFAEIGAAALRGGQPLVATAAPSSATTPASDAAVVAEVEVDTETGVARVLGFTAVLAGGPFEDPRPAEGQVEGALAVALERALAAGVPFDDNGVPVTPSLRGWPLVAATDVAPASVSFLANGEPSTRFGAVAVGEAARRAAVAAVAAAIAQATGGKVRSLPLDPGAVLDLQGG